jgi:hypothetical protein
VSEFPDLPRLRWLLDDVADWKFRSRGPAGYGVAGLRTWETSDPETLVCVVTELSEGISVTNAAEDIAEALARCYPDHRLLVVEHWPAGAGADPAEHLDQVHVPRGGRPVWRRLWQAGEGETGHRWPEAAVLGDLPQIS